MSRLVKGVSRQVIVVKAPDPRFFEQAIFILKEDAFGRGVTADDVLQEAPDVRTNEPDNKSPIPEYA